MSSYDAGLEPGSWGEFFTALEGMTTKMQGNKFTTYELAQALVTPLQANVITTYNAAMTTLVTHATNKQDPHHTLRDYLGLGLVSNTATATPEQITEGGVDDLFVTADGFSALAVKVFGSFGDVLHHQNINPISVYGDVSWLPPDVSGSFEGSGMRSGNSGSFSLIEDDGTLIGLRYGTNGTSQGLYYYSLPNAEDLIDSQVPTRMNLKYTPSNLPGGFICIDTITCDPAVIVGIGAGHATYDGFVSITNNTLDVTKHYVGYFNIGNSFGRMVDQFSSACITNGYVYVFVCGFDSVGTDASGEQLAPYEFVVFRTPTAAIIVGSAVVWEKVSNWNTTNGFWGALGTNPNLRLANNILSSNPANKPFLLHEHRPWTVVYSPVHSGKRSMLVVNPDNPNQVRFLIYHTIWSSLANGVAPMPNLAFSVLVDLVSKTVALEDGASYIKHVSPDSNTLTFVSTSMIQATQISGFPYVGNFWMTTLITERGYILARGTGNQPDENSVFIRSKLDNFISRFDAARISKRLVRPIANLADAIKTGSAFTNNVMNPRLLPGNNIIFTATASDGHNQWAYGISKRLTLTGSPTFNYKTINSGNILGYPPNGTRKELGQITDNQGIFISRTGADGTSTCDASVMISTGTGVSGTKIDQDLVISGSFTYSLAESKSLATAVARQAFGGAVLYRLAYAIYVPQDINLPVLLVLGATTQRSDAIGFRTVHLIAELNYGGARSGLVAGYTLNRIINSYFMEQQPGDVYINPESHGGLQSYKCVDGTYLLVIGNPAQVQVYGSAYGVVWYAAVRAGTKTIEDSTIRRYQEGYFPNDINNSGFVHPTHGICMMDYPTQQANFNSIMVMNVMGTTYADYLAWAPKSKIILGAQEVEQGWTIYFTSPTMVFLSGREYTLPASTIDLRTIDASPGNKTFYVYVRLTTLGIEYFVTTLPLAPTMTMMYIGVVKTISTQISTIQISKKVRIDTFELSTVHAGSAVPITVGVPSSVGDFTGWQPTWLRTNRRVLKFGCFIDYAAKFSVNLRTGVVTVSIQQNPWVSYSRPVTCYENSEVWDPAIVTTVTNDDNGVLVYESRQHTFAPLALQGVANASYWNINIANFLGRDADHISITQPSPANDYTGTILVIDMPGGDVHSAEYSFDVILTTK